LSTASETPEGTGYSVLSRRNLRDVVILVCAISSFLYPVSLLCILVALGVLVVGCVFHFIAKGQLIRNIVMCKDGMYAVVRHPYYLSNYLIDSSFCLLSGNHYILLAYPFLFFWAYGPTLRKEEGLLASKYGTQFFGYSLMVHQIFPDNYTVRNFKSLFNGFSFRRITLNELARIVRFWATAVLMMLIHTVGSKGFHNSNISGYLHDRTILVFSLLVVLLYGASFALAAMASSAKKALRNQSA
jgi:protein-S-isoprenylcysteine O-methyltransferase Ste14